MINWQELSQQLQGFINAVIRFIKARRREQASLGIAAILFWLSYSLFDWLPPELQKFIEPNGKPIITGVFFSAGVGFLFYASYRIWKLVYTPDLPPPANRPSAIKGPLAFTQADGELFRKLGREDELRKLLGYIQDDQTRLIVLMGASGVGKTSLLRAGLNDILKNTAIKFHYWEAVPTDSAEGLLSAIQKSWDSKAVVKLESLDELVNPKPEFGKHIIVLDQFEQLGNNYESEIFKLLRKVCREAKPPYQVFWLITFRREYRANWSDFMIPEQERSKYYSPEFSLQLFSADQARDVISQLLKEADMQIEEKIVDSLVTAATVEGKVSSVDIGIGLQVLAELHSQKSSKTLTVKDYHFAGGAEGLLTQYISRCLEPFSEEDRKTILNAMLALRNAETNQRIAEGKTFDEIAEEVKAVNIRLLKVQLERLTQRDVRLLEQITVVKDDKSFLKYRLPHERIIPSLNRLTITINGEMEEAKLKFGSAFSAWKSDRSSQYLLKGKTLRQVEQFKKEIQWKEEESQKLKFLIQSQKYRLGKRLASLGLIFSVLIGSWFGYKQIQNYRETEYLRQNNYPPEFYNYLKQLKSLEISSDYKWQYIEFLQSDNLEELKINVPNSVESLESLRMIPNQFPNLKKLELSFTDMQGKNIEVLQSFPDQIKLRLSAPFNNSKSGDIDILKGVPNLSELELKIFNDSQIKNLDVLNGLTNLTDLKILFVETQIGNLGALENLDKLENLQLDFGYENRKLFEDDFTVFNKIKNMRKLDLSIKKLSLDQIKVLKNLTSLEQLNLSISDFNHYEVSSKELKTFTNISKLKLEVPFNGYNHEDYWNELPSFFQEMELSLDEYINFKESDKFNTIQIIKFNQNRIIGNPRLDYIPTLEPFPNIKQLTISLSETQIKDLHNLSNLNLTKLDLDLRGSQIDSLNELQKITNLSDLTLILIDSNVKDKELKILEEFSNLKQLTLYISKSKVTDLGFLQNLNCETLDITLSNEQRMSLKTIPKSVTSLSF
jgi:hypothetical protein